MALPSQHFGGVIIKQVFGVKPQKFNKKPGVTFFNINPRSGLLENEEASEHPNDVS